MRTARAGELSAGREGEVVTLAGWVARRRDHGGVAFVDLRDASGLVQVVADPVELPAVHELRMEFCISLTGEVRRRPKGTENPNLPTGEVEVAAKELTILSPSETLPFMLDERTDLDERTRLEYRYLDLRRPRMAANLRVRSRVVATMRRTMDRLGFLEVETPTLIASTPEGARDFLVPSRHAPGSFYALPQSPQLFKQLLMIAGVERYYQVAKCYRDEDFRSDRQVEFAQLDLEGSFWGRDEVLATLEEIICAVAEEVRGAHLKRPFPRLTWQEAMTRYGTDKPDLRFGMEITDLTDLLTGTHFQAFASAIGQGGVVRGINAGGQDAARSRLDGLVARARELGAAGLVWMVVEASGGVRSPAAKHLAGAELDGIGSRLGSTSGDLLLLASGEGRMVAGVLGQLRLELGRPAGHDSLAPVFIIDFPTFEPDGAGGLAPSHHPFTAPVDVEQMERDPLGSISQAYDLVLNGSELGSGSVRIHDPSVQTKVFEILGITPEQAERRFGWFLRALRFGTPPHAGFAIGIDRLVAILQNEPNIREVIPFPKTQTGADPLTGSPTPVEPWQLAELGIRLHPPSP
jgi:aspartyl-tRNA synthetase